VRQVNGYAKEPAIDGLVLVTAKPVTLGPTIGGKPVAVLDLAVSADRMPSFDSTCRCLMSFLVFIRRSKSTRLPCAKRVPGPERNQELNP
jgi:hypothetical protein